MNESYDAVVSNILMMDPLPSFNKVYSLVSRVERQRNVNLTNAGVLEVTALAVKTSEPKPSQGKSPFKKKDPQKKDDRSCTHCGKQGHLEETCFKKNGYPEWFKEKFPKDKKNTVAFANNVNSSPSFDSAPRNLDQDTSSIAEIVQMEIQKFMKGKSPTTEENPITANTSFFASDFAGITTATSPSISWIVDSGASSHMCGRKDFLIDCAAPKATRNVYLPDGTSKSVTLIGTVKISDHLILRNVLYVPGFSYNLISVPKLCSDSHIQVLFHSTGCVIQDLMNNCTLGRGRLHHNLYVLRPHDVKSCPTSLPFGVHSTSLAAVDCEVWHDRMGHPSAAVLKHLPFVNQMNDDTVCSTCHLAKQTRLSFSLSNTKTNAFFELLHVDVCGPFNESSLSGARFMLTIVDDYSKGVWTFLMQ